MAKAPHADAQRLVRRARRGDLMLNASSDTPDAGADMAALSARKSRSKVACLRRLVRLARREYAGRGVSLPPARYYRRGYGRAGPLKGRA